MSQLLSFIDFILTQKIIAVDAIMLTGNSLLTAVSACGGG